MKAVKGVYANGKISLTEAMNEKGPGDVLASLWS